MRRVLVTDLDNTLWDWFAAWFTPFNAMLDELERTSGVPRGVLELEAQQVHKARGTVEYSNLLDELPSLRATIPNANDPVWPHYSSALEILRTLRRSETKLYPHVRETLTSLKEAGMTVIAYTESLAYWSEWRVRHTGLDGVIDILYTSPDHELPSGMTADDLRSRPADYYGLEHTSQRQVPKGVVKPNPEVLIDILEREGFQPHESAYIGDSLMKDIAMAQAVGVLDIHAKYGEVQMKPEYDLLRRVTHWPKVHVEKERSLSHDNTELIPTLTCDTSFQELLPILDLER